MSASGEREARRAKRAQRADSRPLWGAADADAEASRVLIDILGPRLTLSGDLGESVSKQLTTYFGCSHVYTMVFLLLG